MAEPLIEAAIDPMDTVVGPLGSIIRPQDSKPNDSVIEDPLLSIIDPQDTTTYSDYKNLIIEHQKSLVEAETQCQSIIFDSVDPNPYLNYPNPINKQQNMIINAQTETESVIEGDSVMYNYALLKNDIVRHKNYAAYNFEKEALELGRAQWPNYGDQHYLRGCKWSPDGTCLLTVVRGAGMHVVELPPDLYTGDTISPTRSISPLTPAISVPESGLIYDYCWYPGMNSGNPATCCWLSSGHAGPIHLWDAFTGNLRCTYRGYNSVDEMVCGHHFTGHSPLDLVESALCLSFSADGQNIFCGYKKNVKIFATGRPGRVYAEYPIPYQSSCIVASQAQPGIVAIGNVKNGIDLVSQSEGNFRHLCKLQGHKGGITSMAFSMDGYRLYSGARKDNELICWDLRVPGRPLFVLPRQCNTNQKISIDLTEDGKWLVSGGTDGKIQVWDVSEVTYPTVHMQMALHKDAANGVSLHPYRPILATSSGQHHALDPLHPGRSVQICENALCMWWVGAQTSGEDDLMGSIYKNATSS